MAYREKSKGADLAIVFGSPKKPGPKNSPIPNDNEEMGETEDDDEDEEMLKSYCEGMGISPEEFKDAVRIAMK